jgi:hypothetical protein
MRKIRLNVDALTVESFDTAEGSDDARGTVRGNWTRYAGGTCIQTQCGAECPSGPYPCEGSYAWTDGMAACLCADYTEPCIYTESPCTQSPCID